MLNTLRRQFISLVGNSVSIDRESKAASTFETLEGRRLMSATVAMRGLFDGSETSPATTGMAQFYVTRTGPTDKALTVSYRRGGGTTAGTGDYQALSGTITIAKGRNKAFINVVPINDSSVESTEKLVLSVDTSNGYTVDAARRHGTITIADNDAPTTANFAAPISVNVGPTQRVDKVVDQSINFTSLINQAGKSGAVNLNSIRVVETNAAGTSIIDAAVPFQFDAAYGFNASTNASGTLAFQLTGETASNATRHFKVTFATGGTFAAPTIANQVTVTEADDEGLPAFVITTPAATYGLQKANGGFSTMRNADGVDFIGYSNAANSTASGEWRGAPKLAAHVFEPGQNNGTVTLVASGPLKATFLAAVVENGQTWRMRYEVYATHVQSSVLETPVAYSYQFNGVPGVSMEIEGTPWAPPETESDNILLSTGGLFGVEHYMNESLRASNGNEYMQVSDHETGDYFFVAHNNSDNVIDSYEQIYGAMTKLQFGHDRDTNTDYLTGQHTFSFGIGENGRTIASLIYLEGAYQSVNATLGNGQNA